ncbi:MAG: Uma2 family endonuclease [Candidatus Riflebacteria bacterium]|nr:Uma2 family endonuclease [Candidatus Riflebacteria bacterium]
MKAARRRAGPPSPPRTGSPGRGRKKFTYGDYCSWGDEGRWELIDGTAYDMTPAPSRTHADVAGDLFVVFKNFLKGNPCKVYAAPFDVRLPKGKEADDEVTTVVQPDVLVVCDEGKLDEKGCRGAPDFVIEVLSPSTASKDCIKKRALYEKHGVKEFWLVDPANRLVTVYQRGEDGTFGKPALYAEEDTITVGLFPGLKIDLGGVFPALPPRAVREPPPRYL